MLFQIFTVLCTLHATIVSTPAGSGRHGAQEMIVDELKQDASMAVTNNDTNSVKILLSLDKEIPSLFTKAHFSSAINTGSDRLVKVMLKTRKASTWVSEDKHGLISEAHRLGRSVPLLVELLKSSNMAAFLLASRSFSSSSSDSDEDNDKKAPGDHEKMLKIAKLANLHDVVDAIQSGNNPNKFTTEAVSIDNSSKLANKIVGVFIEAYKTNDFEVISMLGNCTAVSQDIRKVFQNAVFMKNYQMIQTLCKLPSFDVSENNFEASRLAAASELSFDIMAILFRKERNQIRKLPFEGCVTICIENGLVSVLKHLSNFVVPPECPFGLESLTSTKKSSNFVKYLNSASKLPNAVELLQILLDENGPFVKEVTTKLKMKKYQDLICDAHKSGKIVLRDELFRLALRAFSNLPAGFDTSEFIQLASVERGVKSLIELCRLDPPLNHDLVRELLNNLFDVSFE